MTFQFQYKLRVKLKNCNPSTKLLCRIIRINYQGRKDCEQNTAICGLKVHYELVKHETVNLGKTTSYYPWPDIFDPYQWYKFEEFQTYLGKMKTVRKSIGVNGLTFKCCPILQPGRYFETPETSLSYYI